MKLDLSKVLDEEYDTRKTRIEQLPVAQIRHECNNRGLPITGRKVYKIKFLKILS